MVLNVASVDPTAVGFLTVHPTGQVRPLASNVNLSPGGQPYPLAALANGHLLFASGLSLAEDHIAVCDLNRFLAADVIFTFDDADFEPWYINHVMRLSPDGSTLVGLTDSGVTLVRLGEALRGPIPARRRPPVPGFAPAVGAGAGGAPSRVCSRRCAGRAGPAGRHRPG